MAQHIRIVGFLEARGRFKRNLKKLDERMKEDLRDVQDELIRGSLQSGRQFEKLKVRADHYSVRLSRSYRFIFSVDEHGIANPISVAPHDDAYRIDK